MYAADEFFLRAQLAQNVRFSFTDFEGSFSLRGVIWGLARGHMELAEGVI